LVDAEFKGKPRKLLVEANRNGFIMYWIADRRISFAIICGEVELGKGIDERAPHYDKTALATAGRLQSLPGFSGRDQLVSPSYYPETRTLFFMSQEECTIFSFRPPNVQRR